MQPRNIRVIYMKEIRDILRDRRTLFLMTVLPILLYPVLWIGMAILMQVQMRKVAEEKSVIVVVGREQAPSLVERILSHRAPEDKAGANEPKESDVPKETEPPTGPGGDDVAEQPPAREPDKREQRAIAVLRNLEVRYEAAVTGELRQEIIGKKLGVIVEIPEQFAATLETGDEAAIADARVRVWYDAGQEKSVLLKEAIAREVDGFKDEIFKAKLASASIPRGFLEPFVSASDVGAEKAILKGEVGNLLAKLLAFMIVTMSLTGAFYPAIDLAAGEKERGTMETLLISPAARSEIVIGKYLVVFTVACISALCNIASMGFSLTQIPGLMGAKAGAAMHVETNVTIFFYMLLVLVPLVALFSALSLALSTFARSFKEGQNYLNPLITISFLPSMAALLPGFELNNVLSFVPVLSASLLFRELFANNFQLSHILLTFGSTLIYSVIAMQWTVSLFEREEVLFRESEEINWKFWIKRGLKRLTASPYEAVVGYLIVVAAWFYITSNVSPASMVKSMLISHYVVILGVPLLLLRVLNVDWRAALSWRLPSPGALALTLPFALAMIVVTRLLISWLYRAGSPGVSEEMQEAWNAILQTPFWLQFLLIAVTPAITEEVLCRGFLFSSFRAGMGVWRAALVSALMFGFLHMNADQLPNAIVLGIPLAYLVARTGSILPAMMFHFINNGGVVLYAHAREQGWLPAACDAWDWLIDPEKQAPSSAAYWMALAAALAIAAICYRLIPRKATPPMTADSHG